MVIDRFGRGEVSCCERNFHFRSEDAELHAATLALLQFGKSFFGFLKAILSKFYVNKIA